MEIGSGISVLTLLYILIFVAVVSAIVWKYRVKRNKRKTAASRTEEVPQRQKPTANNDQTSSENNSAKSAPFDAKQQGVSESPKIFISYRRTDSINITGRIYDRLVQQFGTQNVFKDVDSIPLGVDFRAHLNDVLAETSVSLVFIGTSWLSNGEHEKQSRLSNPLDFVRIEVETALERNIPVIPLFVHDATMPLATDLPDTLKSLVYRNGISIRPDPDFHNDINRLLRALTDYVK